MNSTDFLLEFFRQLELRAGLLTCLAREQDASLRARICDIVGDLSGEIMECNEWPEILSYSQLSIQVKNFFTKFLQKLSNSHNIGSKDDYL